MMVLQVVSESKAVLHEIANDLLDTDLITNVMISDAIQFKTKDSEGRIVEKERFMLKGLSKSLLFRSINVRLRELYGKNMPLVYAEPIIMIDPEQTEDILRRLVAV